MRFAGRMEWGFRRRFRRRHAGVGIISSLKWVKGLKLSLGLIISVAMQHCPKSSPSYSLWRSIGMQWLMKCGTLVLAKEVGTSDFLETLMIGSWI